MSGKINENQDLTGKVVTLKSGGPLMVAVTKGERWECRWFDRLASGEHAINGAYFHAHELAISEKQPAPVPGPSGRG